MVNYPVSPPSTQKRHVSWRLFRPYLFKVSRVCWHYRLANQQTLKRAVPGLNLPEADYVFIVDPWWNPAVENQAIDRNHRIGQNKHVMAYRMILSWPYRGKNPRLVEKKAHHRRKYYQRGWRKEIFWSGWSEEPVCISRRPHSGI